MSKKRQTNISRHIKTSHKKALHKRKITNLKVDPAIKDINKVVTKAVAQTHKHTPAQDPTAKPAEGIPLETMPMDSFRKLLGEDSKKKDKVGKLTVDDSMQLEKLIKRWGDNYGRMAQDFRLNKLQWTARQIEKKHETYKKLFPEEAGVSQ